MIGRQLHDNASYSDKVFCPGYGEFFTEKTLDLEALAFAVPTDKLSESLPPELLTIRSGVEKIYPAVSNDDWETIQNEINLIKTAWNSHKNSKKKISSGMATQMDRAIRNIEGDTLEPGALSQHKIGTLNGAIDIHFAILDLEMQYRSSEEIDRDRIVVWSQKILIDAVAMEQGFLLSDIRSLSLLHERLRSVLPTAKANSLIIRINRLHTATRKEDFKTVTTISKQLLDTFKTR